MREKANSVFKENESMILASSKSTMVSLAGVRIGRYELSEHRKNLLLRVPKEGNYAFFDRDSIELMDLAYLSAKTGDEFAILRSKNTDVLFHGGKISCRFIDELEESLRNHRYELIGHSHPGEEEPEPSPEDRTFLRTIGQKYSSVISARTGRVTVYTADPFDEGRF